MPRPKSLAALEGRWTMRRNVEHADGRIDRMDGVATFVRAGHRLIHDETGKMHIPGHAPMKATRRYIWTQETGRFEVFFADMRPFHTVSLSTDRPETVHLCPPDRYAVFYDFTSFPEWSTVWEVTGPRKDYRMRTAFSRSAAESLLAADDMECDKPLN